MNEVESLRLRLELGSFEMSAEQLLSLRPGDSIRCEQQGPFLGRLCLGAADWFLVEIEVQEDALQVHVQDFASREEFFEESRLTQETFSADLREGSEGKCL